MIEILPSILSADFARLGQDIERVTAAGATMIHVDVMDGHFVPNISLGVPVVQSIRKVTKAVLDCHLMMAKPDEAVPWFLEAGANQISVHREAAPHLDRTLRLIQAGGAKAGVVLNPATPVSSIVDILPVCDFVLIMSVNPGFGGQHFLEYTLDKVAQLVEQRRVRGLGFRIEIDGGMNETTVPQAARAGVDWFVAGSAIFGAPDPGAAFQQLRQLALDAAAIKV